jgi:hypothetical protein
VKMKSTILRMSEVKYRIHIEYWTSLKLEDIVAFSAGAQTGKKDFLMIIKNKSQRDFKLEQMLS